MLDREKLLKKRDELKAKIHISTRIKLIQELIDLLDTRKVEYNIHLECDRVDRVFQQYPINFSGLNWTKIPHSQVIYYTTLAERNQIISNAIAECLKQFDRAFVIWSNGLRPMLELSIKDIIDNIEPIVDEDCDLWILQLEKGFCLEHYHEGYIGWTVKP